MATPEVVEPDLEFVEEIAQYGGETCRQCFQCATCSVVCKLSPDERPFPRKEMIWAQWGLRDRLVGDPDVWLCHHCNDCSINCPRGAKPGNLMAAIRAFSFKHYAWPRALGKLVADPKKLPVTLGAALVLVLALIFVSNGGSLALPTVEQIQEHAIAHGRFTEVTAEDGAVVKQATGYRAVEYGVWLGHMPLNVFFSALTGLVFVAFVIGTRRMWAAMEASLPADGDGSKPEAKMSTFAAFVAGAAEFFAHSKFSQCGANKTRYYAHLLTFYGFFGLLIATAIVVLLIIIDPSSYPADSIFHWLKILANLSMIAFIVGLTIIIRKRLTDEDYAGPSTTFDWTFLWVIYAVAWTGFLVQFFRLFAAVPAIAYPLYVLHLTAVFFLIVYAPYSKFAHMVYRAVAIVFAKKYGRS